MARSSIAIRQLLLVGLIAVSAAIVSTHLARAGTACDPDTLGRQKSQLLDALGKLQERESALRSEIADTQSSDPKVLIKRLGAEARFASTCVKQLRRGEPTDKNVCAMHQEAVAYYKGRLNEIATHVPDDDTGPWLERLHQFESDFKNQRQRLGDEIAAANDKIEACRSEESTAAKPCTTSIVGSWKWWNGFAVTFTEGGGASYRGSSSGSGSWQHVGGNQFHVHWATSNTDDYFSVSRDGTKLEGSYDGKFGVSTRTC